MNLTGYRRFAGFSKQSDSTLWTFSWVAPDGVTVINANGQLCPLSGSLRHNNDVKRLKDGRGNTVTVLATDEAVTIEIVAVPQGASGANSLRDALQAATFPGPNGFLTIANAPVIPMGTFGDVFNAANWMYNGDGSIELASDNEWGMRFSCTRYNSIPVTAAVVV